MGDYFIAPRPAPRVLRRRSKRHTLTAPRGGFVDQAAITLDLSLGELDVPRERGVFVIRQLPRLTFRLVDRVSQALSRRVSLTTRAHHLQSKASLVEGLLSHAPCSIQLGSNAIPESHYSLAVQQLPEDNMTRRKNESPLSGAWFIAVNGEAVYLPAATAAACSGYTLTL